MPSVTPNTDDLRAMVDEALGVALRSARRFPTGLCHYVYDAVLADGRAVVLRVAAPENVHYLAGAVHWSRLLRSLGLPLPELLHARLLPGRTLYAYLILERLPGEDLGHVYASLSGPQRKTLACQLAGLQERVGALPEGTGFGCQSDPRHPPPYRTWAQAVEASIDRSAQWIQAAGVVDPCRAHQVRQVVCGLGDYFATIRPQPFLDDITTKNVLIHHGQLAGIVDVDELCFGDRVALLGLTRMALLADHLPTDYIEHWCTALRLGEAQRRALDFYTAETCLCFLGEQGQAFNHAEPPPVDRTKIRFLEATLDQLLATFRA